MKKIILLIIALIIVGGGFYFFTKKPANHTQEPINYNITKKGNADIIKVTKPEPNEVIDGLIIIEGEARGTWYFEASFPIKLYDENNNLLGTTVAQAQGEWMTENYVPFKANFGFHVSSAQKGTLVLEKDNPSGLPENSDELRIPVVFREAKPTGETMKVNVYFNNSNMDPIISCNKVFPVEREIAETTAVGRASLEELLKGPTEKEFSDGYTTSMPTDVKIQSLVIENEVAKVDFNDKLEYQVGGSCRVTAIRTQIIQTLKQFPIVKEVIISINGRIEDILQP